MRGYRFHKKGGPRVLVTLALFLAMLVSVNFFEIKPMVPLLADRIIVIFVAVLLLILLRAGFSSGERIPEAKQMSPMLLVALGIVISFVPAYIYYKQGVLQSVISYREGFYFLFLPAFLMSRPSATEIRRALYLFSAIWLVISVLVTYRFPEWIELPDDMSYYHYRGFLMTIPGLRFLGLAFIFALDRFYHSARMTDLIAVIGTFVCVFIPQNRTLLAASLLIVLVFAFFRRSSGQKVISVGITLLVGGVFLYFTAGYILALIGKTVSQLQDMDYNRVKAYYYMVSGSNGWLSYIWGNGYISGKVSSLISDLHEEGIYYNDVGLLGMWNQFGILPVAVLLFSFIRGLSRHHSFLVVANAVFLLVGTLTISYFFIGESILWVCLYWYVYEMDEPFYQVSRQQYRERKARQALRYRSIGGE